MFFCKILHNSHTYKAVHFEKPYYLCYITLQKYMSIILLLSCAPQLRSWRHCIFVVACKPCARAGPLYLPRAKILITGCNFGPFYYKEKCFINDYIFYTFFLVLLPMKIALLSSSSLRFSNKLIFKSPQSFSEVAFRYNHIICFCNRTPIVESLISSLYSFHFVYRSGINVYYSWIKH